MTERIELLLRAAYTLEQYCKNYRCSSCMMNRPTVGCFFRHYDLPAPEDWDCNSIYDEIMEMEEAEQ